MKTFKELLEEVDLEAFEEWEFTEEQWDALSEDERAELETEAANGGAVWKVGDDDDESVDGIYEDDDEDLDEAAYKARNTGKRRVTQRTKDLNKFKDRAKKRTAKINRKKPKNRVKRLKLRKKWIRRNKVKIKNAQRVYGGKVKSKFTKKR